MAYDYTNGDGLDAFLVTEPNGATEPLSNLDNAIRQVKAYLMDPLVGPDAKIEALASPIRVITTHAGANQDIDESDGEVVVQFNNIDLDSGGDFNNATYLFTAPEDGLYLVVAQVAMQKTSGTTPVDILHQLDVMIGGVSGARYQIPMADEDAKHYLPITRLFNLSASQTLSVRYRVTVASGTITMRLLADPRESIFQVTRFALS